MATEPPEWIVSLVERVAEEDVHWRRKDIAEEASHIADAAHKMAEADILLFDRVIQMDAAAISPERVAEYMAAQPKGSHRQEFSLNGIIALGMILLFIVAMSWIIF